MPGAAFTVIELVVVIGVLSVLLAILLPVFNNVRESTQRTRAQIEATALVQAVIQYKNLYGYWPGMVTADGGKLKVKQTPNRPANVIDWPLVSHFSNEWFKVTIRSTDPNIDGKFPSYITDNTLYRSLLPFDKSGGADNRNPLNPNRIRFLNLQNEETPEHASFPDPWGRQYIVVMGLNPRTAFTHEFKTESGDLIDRLSFSNLTAFALSYGEDKKSLIFSAGITNGIVRRAN